MSFFMLLLRLGEEIIWGEGGQHTQTFTDAIMRFQYIYKGNNRDIDLLGLL